MRSRSSAGRCHLPGLVASRISPPSRLHPSSHLPINQIMVRRSQWRQPGCRCQFAGIPSFAGGDARQRTRIFDILDGNVTVVSPEQAGTKLDADASANAIEAALAGGANVAALDHILFNHRSPPLWLARSLSRTSSPAARRITADRWPIARSTLSWHSMRQRRLDPARRDLLLRRYGR